MFQLDPTKYTKVSTLNANLIREFREDLGMTQEEFAQYLGIPKNTLATYEVGANLGERITDGKQRILRMMGRSESFFVARNEYLKARHTYRAFLEDARETVSGH